MRTIRYGAVPLMAILVVFLMVSPGWSGGTLGKMIDSTNWQEIEGMVPDSALTRIKNGEYTFQLATLDFNPVDYMAPWIRASLKENAGKYDVNEKDEIVVKATGERAGFFKGLPFPMADLKKDDPKIVQKIMHNGFTFRDAYGPMNTSKQRLTMVYPDKFDREVVIRYWAYPFYGYPPSGNIANEREYQNTSLILVTEPYDMSGTAMMTWRYKTDKPDTLFGYVPAIRRIRRMTPAGRSDALFGTDFTRDDGNWTGFDGKISDFEWKLLGEKEVLAELHSLDISQAEKNKRGAWKAENNGPDYPKFGYEIPGDKGSAWWNKNSVWVKRKVWVIEATAKDPYYNYGKMVYWVDKDMHIGLWKLIWDRSDTYWKTMNISSIFLESKDKSWQANLVGYWRVVDEIKNHCTLVLQHTDGEFVWTLEDELVKTKDFSLAGFQQLCK
jgi:hypothetical protein